MKIVPQSRTNDLLVSTTSFLHCSQRIVVLIDFKKKKIQPFCLALLLLTTSFGTTTATPSLMTKAMNDCGSDTKNPERWCRKIILPDSSILEEILKPLDIYRDNEEEELCRVSISKSVPCFILALSIKRLISFISI